MVVEEGERIERDTKLQMYKFYLESEESVVPQNKKEY